MIWAAVALLMQLGTSAGLGVLVLTYNVAGIFREESESYGEFLALRQRMLGQYPQLRDRENDLYIFNFQECFNAKRIVREILVGGDYPKLARKVCSFAGQLLAQARPGQKFSCGETVNHALVTVVCRLGRPSLRPWVKKAFEVGWTKHGREYKGVLLGFKGLLGTQVALDATNSLLVVNLHLSVRSLKDRLRALAQCYELIKSHLHVPSRLVVLAGDFNARSFSNAIPKEGEVRNYEKNIGARYLHKCLDSLSGEAKAQTNLRLGCRQLLDLVLRYDEVRATVKRLLHGFAEPKKITFEPTYCFNTRRSGPTAHRKWLCEHGRQLIPSYCDRILAHSGPCLRFEWKNYFSSGGREGELSDHVPVLAQGFILGLEGADPTPYDATCAASHKTGLTNVDENDEFDREEYKFELLMISSPAGTSPRVAGPGPLNAFLARAEANYALKEQDELIIV